MIRRSLLVSAVALAAAVPAQSAQASVCVPVRADGVGQAIGPTETVADVTTHGLLLGHTHATFVAGEAPGSFSGPIVFTTVLPGTLTAQVAGGFDTTGHFHATSTSVSGTGVFRP